MDTKLAEIIKERKLVAILRGIRPDAVVDVVNALEAGGISLVEIPFDQRERIPAVETAKAISEVCEQCPNVIAGAGTVMTGKQLSLAIAAGARFILSPDVNAAVIQKTKIAGLISIPGAITPSECAAAWRAGADFIKLFPAGALGCGYFRSIAAPLSHIPFLCVGGIRETNLPEFLAAGAAGFGIGGELICAGEAEEYRWDAITRRATEFVRLIAQT